MSWKNSIKKATNPKNLNESYDNVLYWGQIFDEIGWLGAHDAWFYFGKPHKWQPEYEIMLNVMRYVEENMKDEIQHYDDPLAISEYLHDDGYNSADEWKRWLDEKGE